MFCVWVTSAYHSEHCTDRYQDTKEERTRSTKAEGHRQQTPTKMGLAWEEADVVALDRHGWRRSMAQYVQLDAG